MNQFEQFAISQDITKALALLGLQTPTPVQEAVIPLALQKKDILAQAQTGSGKTAAFAIPLCQLVEWEENKPQALVLTPTRELAMQVQEEIANIGKLKRIKVPALYGSHSFHQQERDLKQKAHIVVGTPGRVLDHLERGTLLTGCIQYVVIDEADEMLKLGFLEQVSQIIETMPIDRVIWLFSATMPKNIRQLAADYLQAPEEVEIESEPITTDRIVHQYYNCADWDKIDLLQGVLMVRNPDSCIIFANTRDMVDQICDELLEADFTCDRLHGGMEQRERTQVMGDFKRGEFRYLVATDVAARGIDVDDISLVVNFELPWERENYLHRIGRTGRAGQEGAAISLVEQQEAERLRDLEHFIQLPIDEVPIPTLEEVEAAEPEFFRKMRQMPKPKAQKSAAFAQEIMKLHIDAGKKSKIRPVDIVGTLCAIPGMKADDIGIITIMDWSTYVEVLNGKGQMVIDALKTKPLKGQLRKVSRADR